jgi:kexin
MSRDEYGFEMVEGHDADEDVNGGAAGGSRRNKRAGELYDAFAEGSDEDTPFGLDSEDESDGEEGDGKERYRDGDQRGDMRS